MNKIHHVDDKLGYAILEPGVTYQQLNDHLKAHHPTLWADCAGSTVNASVIGNALDRGRGLTPYADHCAHLCGMDVVTPDGALISLGGGARDQDQIRHLYKWGVGPYIEGLFAQSNFGIVVKSGLWLMPAPEKFDFFVFEYTAKPEQFKAFLTDFQTLMFRGVIQSHPHFANDFAMLCIVDQYPFHLLEKDGTKLSKSAMGQWKKALGVSDWTFGCGLYGSKTEIQHHKKILKRTLGKYGQLVFLGGCEKNTLRARMTLGAAKLFLRLQGKTPKLLEGLPKAIRLFKGIPTDYFVRQVYFKSHIEKPAEGQIDPSRDGCGFIWIGPLIPYDPDQIMSFCRTIEHLYERHKFDYFIELMPESPRCMMALFGIFYDKENADQTARAQALYQDIFKESYDCGYYPYRTTTTSHDGLFDSNKNYQSFVNTLKQAIDPNGIIAPGRYGVGESPK